jgi:hypothetical protein
VETSVNLVRTEGRRAGAASKMRSPEFGTVSGSADALCVVLYVHVVRDLWDGLPSVNRDQAVLDLTFLKGSSVVCGGSLPTHTHTRTYARVRTRKGRPPTVGASPVRPCQRKLSKLVHQQRSKLG